MRICRIATIPFPFLNHLRNQIMATLNMGHEVTLVCSPDTEFEELKKLAGIRLHPLQIEREISPWADVKALMTLTLFFRRERFDVVHSMTQKAALLAAIAGRATGIPVRLHTFTGQPWLTRQGAVRWIAKACDRLMTRLNTQCYADSASQRDILIKERIGNSRQISVLGHGSLAGVDLKKFTPPADANKRKEVKKQLGIPETAQVITFIGRLNRDKGVNELFHAFKNLRDEGLDVTLIMVGPLEKERDPLPPNLIHELHNHPRVKLTGYSTVPELYLSVSELLCLPSYREGFGNVVIEAAAMGVPTVATRTVGLVDSVEDGKTGILVPPRDSRALTDAIKSLLTDEQKRLKMASEARSRAVELFDEKIVNSAALDEYEKLWEQIKELSIDKDLS